MLPVVTTTRALLEVRDLTVSYAGSEQLRPVVCGLSFDVHPGEILGIQGRSGCGKTSAALALLRLLPEKTHVRGSAMFRGIDLLKLKPAELRKLRGREISIMYQEAALALNPVMRIGDQIAEVARAHGSHDSRNRREMVEGAMESVRLNAARFYRAYPHELSGGERHRVLLAQALICRPALVIADEPTAGLDATLRTEILDLIESFREQFRVAFILISHDHAVISRLADRTIELPSETSQTESPRQSPSSFARLKRPSEIATEPLIVIRNLNKRYRSRGLFKSRQAEKHALDSVDLTIAAGRLLALVGSSGSGKSTLARCLALLEEADSGEILLAGRNLLALGSREKRHHRPLLQYVFQDPAEALNPRLSAAEVIEEPLLIQARLGAPERRRRVATLMEQVELDPAASKRSCHEFSGGQKQRLAIARALALEPKLLIFDESLSGLDAETQKEILGLLGRLREKLGITQLLISHDLELVSRIADSIAVMQQGRIVNQASSTVTSNPDCCPATPIENPDAAQDLVLMEAK